MALDGVFLRHIKNELENKIINNKVDKIYQPFRDEIIIAFRSPEGSNRLLISARANSPRINLTTSSPENPKVPPMLCMLLRKKLSGARLRNIFQPGLERLLILEFEGKNELGDTVILKLAVEIMGQYSNIIFIDENDVIIDAVKRVDACMSSRRLILPGIKYEMPPAQTKLCMLDCSPEQIISAVEKIPNPVCLDKALLNTIQGISPIICRELEYLTGRGADLRSDELDEDKRTRLSYFLKRIITETINCSGEPCIIINNAKKPIDFTFCHIQQYGSGRSFKETYSFCELLDLYYSKRDAIETMRSRSEDINKLLNSAATRLIKKIYIQKEELAQCADREQLRIFGDLLQANLYRIPKGAAEAEVENYYDENLSTIKIKLDPALSAAANSQKYYKSYRKAKTAEQVLKIQIEKAENELDYVSSVLDSLSRAETIKELTEIREELTDQGYIKAKGKSKKRETPLSPIRYTSKTGFVILVGRNNRQNDTLTLKTAGKNDLWLHTKDIPGSHTVIITEGLSVDEETLLFAASLAASHSKASDAGKVPVDYTKIKYVSKPSGARPGMVIYTNQKTLFVSPAHENNKSSAKFS